MVDAEGGVAAHSGALAIAEAGHIIGDGFTVQANMMLRPTVWPAMAEAYQSTRGELIERLLSTLDAAETEGGDIRGRQSAAILIVAGKNSGRPWADKLYDLRVDDAPEPLKEIRRLVSVARAYNHHRRAQAAIERGDAAAMKREFEIATRLIGDNIEMRFWYAIGLLGIGEIENGIAMLRQIAINNSNWITLALRLRPPLLTSDPELLERIRKLGSTG
jgi:uncharacterized Ntn-hydrolase superfamily protein